VRVFWFLYSP